MMNQPKQVKYEGKVPKTLRAFCDKNADKIVEVSAGTGYATDSGFAYDVLLRAGWGAYGDPCHTVIEGTVMDTLRVLRGLEPCNCEDCEKDIARGSR